MEWLFKKAEEFLRRHKFIRRWRKVLAVMMAMVVFMSTYAMVLPAITLESGEGAEIGLFADTSGDESVPDGSTVTDSIPEAGAEGAALTTETAVIEDTAPAEPAPVENVSTENAPAENTPAEPEAAETAPKEAAPTEAVPTEAAPTSTETPAPKVENLVTPEEPKYLENEKLTFENNSIKLTLTVPAAAKVVKGAAIDVREIGQPFANDGLDENGRKNEYLSYLAAAETALNLTAEEITYIEKNIVNTPAAELPWARFFAISIKNADGLITPACALPVEIIYKNTAETAADGLKVMCLLPNGTMTMIGSETKVATAAQTPIALLSAADSNFDITSKFVDAGTLTFGTFAVQVSEIDAAIEKEKEEAVKAAAEAAKAESATTSDASAAESVESIPTDESAAESADESQEESLPADESLEESLPADESTDESLDESLPADESADESLDESLPEEAEDESLSEEAEKTEDETETEEESKADDKATKTLVTKGTDYTVTMTYTADAKIPAGAILSAKEILPTAYNYKGYFNKATDALNLSDEQKANTRARFFDIKIMLGTSEVTPAVPVQVEITYNKPQENSAFTEMNAVHFGKEGPEVISAEATQADAATGEVNAVGFEAGSFSVYGVMYTVDFETVDGVKWSWPGEGSYSIASILAEIGVADPATDVKLVRTVDEGGAENVLFLEEKEDGWYLTSEAAFRDTFVLSVAAGEKVYIITVTDASEVASSDGIKSLLTGVNITGAKNENGTYVVYPDQPYGIELSFKEVNKNNGQFPMSESFTYQLPSGLVPYGSSVSNYLEVELSGGEHAGEKVKLNYTISQDGLITFRWDKTTSPAAYDQLKDSLYAQFRLELECTYTGDSGTLDFGNDITKDVTVKNNGTVNVNKTGKYNAVTNCVDYTVSVYSDGITKNVVITDTVSGSALTYNRDAVSSSSIHGKEVSSPTSNGNGFSLTIPQMADQETVTVKYSAAVNLDALHKNDDGSWGTFDETGNTVVVKSKDNQDVEDHTYGKDFENKISMSSVGKSGSPVEADETGHATVNWTIHANDNANVSMAGHTISDSISGNSVPMSYNSSGIHVVAYYADGSQAYEKDIVWGSEGLTKDADGQSWSWSVPNRAPDTQKLSYVITYTTDVDVSDRLIKTNVKNHAESDNGGTADYGVDVTPNGGALTARKKVVKTDITSKTVTWEINFDVPATGLNSAQIIDTMPTFWENGQVRYFDSYLGNSTITITPELAAGESYEATTSADGRTLTIDFYKTEDEQKVTGLSATGSARKIRVQFQTEFNEDWLTAAEDHQNETNYTNHTNTGRVLLNGQTIGVSATTKVENNEPGMSKVHGAQDNYYINGNNLPAFPYIVTLSGVSDDSFDDNGSLILEDTFNGKYLAFYPESQDGKGDNALVGRVLASNEYQSNPVWNNDAKTDDSVVTSPAAGKVVINISRDTIPMKDGNYYPYYYVFYYLTVKDPIAVEKLEKEIQNSESGTYPLLNTVTNAKFGTASTTADFSIDVLDKTITSQDGKAYYNNGNWMVDFKLDVNPDALDLGDEEELTLTDDYTNLAVDYTTIKIQKDVNGSLEDTSAADGVSWTRKGNRVTYTLQNGVHYVITYKARITGEPGNDGKVHYDNTAEYFGVKKWTRGDQDIRTGGSGSSPTYGITVFKHEKGAGSAPLSGAKFKLYKYTETQDQENGWENQPSNAINTETRTPVDSGWEAVKEMTTDSDGVAKTLHSDSIQVWTWYMLVETEAPVYEGSEHYQLKDFGYVFWITDKGVADYSHYVYLNDDVVAIDNEPPVPETVDIGVTKTWTNDNGDKTKRKDITVRLYADGVPYDDWTDKNGDHLDARSDTVKVLSLNADGTTDGYTWTGLPGGPVYSVVEDGVAGYTTTYYPKSTQVSGTINIKNKYIPGKTFIHVEKNWSGVAQDSQAEDITVQLKRKVSANAEVRIVRNNGQLITHISVPAGSNVTIGYDGKAAVAHQYYTEQGDVPASQLYRGNSTQAADLISSVSGGAIYSTGNDHQVRYTVNNIGPEGVTLRFPEDYGQTEGEYAPNLLARFTVAPFVNASGGSGGSYSEDVNFNNENHYYTISAANGWKIDIDRLVKEDDDGKYIYYIEEVGVNDNTETPEEAGYTVTYENNDGIEGGTGNAAQDTIKVTNSPEPGSLEVTKTVSGEDAKGTYSIAVKDSNGHYYALDGTDKGMEAFYVSFSKDSTQKWNNLPAGTYTVEEQDASVDGYTWHVTGTGEVEVPVGGNAEAEVTNVYEEKPASGSIKLTKSVTVNGEPTLTNAADGDYTFTITGPNGATATVATVTIKVTGGKATQYKLKDTDPFINLPADKYVVIPDLALGDYVITESPVEGMAVSSITGGKAETVDLANRKVTVTVTADAVVPAGATAAFVNNVKQFKFKKVWLDSNDANANSVDWVKTITVELYGRKASASDTHIGDYVVTFPATSGAAYTAEQKTETIGEKTYKSYEITFSKLSADYDSFYVKEKGLDAYFTTYGTTAQAATTGQMSAGEGEYIINSLIKVELPDTGGPGTLLYSMLGMMLIAFAGTAYMILLRRRKASLKGGGNPR